MNENNVLLISMICVSCSIVILDMLNTFIKNYNYFKSKVNNILSIIIQELSGNLLLLQMHNNAVLPLVNMEMEALNKHYLQKDGDGGFCKNTRYWYSCI